MSKCPDCGRQNVQEPEGHVTHCGRRVTHNDAPGILFPHPSQWKERSQMVAICRAKAEGRETEAAD